MKTDQNKKSLTKSLAMFDDLQEAVRSGAITSRASLRTKLGLPPLEERFIIENIIPLDDVKALYVEYVFSRVGRNQSEVSRRIKSSRQSVINYLKRAKALRTKPQAVVGGGAEAGQSAEASTNQVSP